ncbi:MAG: TAXI family TRAP transporter solute-binding subunit [Sulfurovum sp.]|nr:TAXI family TRAP transporter solute-binding subunit [Sulfurovum sp.]
MKKVLLTAGTIAAFSVMATTAVSAQMYKFSGGPSGGTFQYFAAGISQYTNDNKIVDAKINVSASAGSVQNVRLVSMKKADFAIAYAGDTYLASQGKLSPKDDRKYTGVKAVAYLYGAPAQLIVKKSAGIKSAADLVGKKVGVGKGGSGAAANAERFFKGIGIWDKMKPEFLGYNNAAAAFSNNQLDAFWVFSGYPTAAVIQAAQQNDIDLINVYTDAEKFGVLKKYPFYSALTIPAKTYRGQDNDIKSFQDSALWIANEKVPEDVVYKMLKAVFTDKGLKHMVTIKKTAKQMSVEGGTKGTAELELHPGAIKFWKEKGVIK